MILHYSTEGSIHVSDNLEDVLSQIGMNANDIVVFKCDSFLSASEIFLDGRHKDIHIDRFCDMVIHPGIQCRLFIFGEGVCRHGDDRDARLLGVIHPPYLLCRIVAVHHRHLDIHEHGGVMVLGAVPHGFDGQLAVEGLLDDGSRHFEDFAGDLDIQLVVLHKQDAPAPEIDGRGFVRLRRTVLPLGHDELLKHIQQAGPEQRLGDEGVHSGPAGFLLDFGPVVSRKPF